MPKRAVWLLGALALLAPFTAVAQEQSGWIYRGRMGSHAVLENSRDHSQKIVQVGKTIGGMHVVSIDGTAVVLRSPAGKQFRLEMQTGYSAKQQARYEGIPTYPHAIPQWWTKIQSTLDTMQVTPRWQAVSAEEILRQLMEFSGLEVAATPRAAAHLSQRDALSLNANRMTLRAAFDLTATMLGLRWWIYPRGIQLGLPGEAAQPPPQIVIQRALARARAQTLAIFDNGKRRPPSASSAQRVRASLSQTTVDGEVRADSLAELFRELAGRAGVTLVIDTSILRRLSEQQSTSLRSNRESVNELLIRLVAQHKLGYLIQGTVVQLTSQEQAAKHANARSRADAATKRLAAQLMALRDRKLSQAVKNILPHAFTETLTETLGIPVYCDEATWGLRIKLSFPQGTSIGAVNDKLITERIYPIFLGKALYLIRAR